MSKTKVKEEVKSVSVDVYETSENIKTEAPDGEYLTVSKIGKTNTYATYTLTVKDGKVVSCVMTEPNMRQIAIDLAKISFVKKFMNF